MKKILLLNAAAVFFLTAGAQTLFTYGKYNAAAKDFLKAYNKNNNAESGIKKMTPREYLDMYIASRLKIREAYERRYDTLPQIKSEMENLRSQIIDNYLSDAESVDKLVKEAFTRSQKDIHAAYIFIGFKNAEGKEDSAAARKKISDAWNELKKGADFKTVAAKYSDDPAAKTTGGDMGYITVFSLPYEVENIAYTTTPGKFSAPAKTKSGFIIIKNIDERKASGKASAAQILLAYPPGATDTDKKVIAQRADSVYQLLIKGGDFGKLASLLSNDYISAANSGNMPEFGAGQYDALFENTIFGLKPGVISKPFETTHGWHIVKLISVKPVITDAGNAANMNELKVKVQTDPRIETAKDLLYKKVVSKAGLKKELFNAPHLWLYTDSVLDYKPAGAKLSVTPETNLFKIGNTSFNVQKWVEYAQTWRYKPDGSGIKPYPQVMEEFTRKMVLDYYKDHLEEFNEEFRNYMNEFKDGNLFFEIMQQEIWNKAQTDAGGLKQYYEKHQSKYIWNPSADAIIFYAADEAVAQSVHTMVKSNPAEWRRASESSGDKAIADSSRFELWQIPGMPKGTPKEGMVYDIVVNKTDNSATFAYIIKNYPGKEPRNFEEARGLVVNDYQKELEDKWLAQLKKKYPVKINDAVLKKVVK